MIEKSKKSENLEYSDVESAADDIMEKYSKAFEELAK
jgi:hypothetical protein